MEKHCFYVLRRKDGQIYLCENAKEGMEIELYKGAKLIGTFETTLDILDALNLFKRS